MNYVSKIYSLSSTILCFIWFAAYQNLSYLPPQNIYVYFVVLYSETFGESNVGLLTGDSAVNRDAQILIMTTEILRNMLYPRYISMGACMLHISY